MSADTAPAHSGKSCNAPPMELATIRPDQETNTKRGMARPASPPQPVDPVTSRTRPQAAAPAAPNCRRRRLPKRGTRPRIGNVRQHDANDPEGEQDAVELRRDVVVVDEGERRPGDVCVDARKEEAAYGSEAHKAAVRQQTSIATERGDQGSFAPSFRRKGLRDGEEGCKRREPYEDQQNEDGSPAGEGENLPPDDRPEKRRDGHHRDQRRQHLGRAAPLVKVTDHRTRQDDARASPDRLNHAPENHLRCRVGQPTSGGTDHEKEDADGDRKTTAVAISERPS